MTTRRDLPVSVLMPVYNGEPYLAAAVESILAQTFSDFEFIIIDDGSTDKTRDIAESYAAQDKRIRLVGNKSNQGMARSLNKGLALAQGRYVARMDADDISLPHRLGEQVAFLDRQPQIGVLGCAVQVIDPEGRCEEVVRFPPDHGMLRWVQCFYTPLAHPTVVMRRQLVLKAEGYRNEYEPADDRDLWQRLGAITRLANLDEVLLLYRRHPASVSHRESATQIWNSARVGQRMVAEVLGKDVPLELCWQIRRWAFATKDEAWLAAHLVSELYGVFATDPNLSAHEKESVRRDAARRLFDLSWFWRDDPKVHQFLLEALRLDLFLVLGTMGRKIGRRLILQRNVAFLLPDIVVQCWAKPRDIV